MASTRISDIRGPVGPDGPVGPAGPNTVPTQQAVADAITTPGSAAEVAVTAKVSEGVAAARRRRASAEGEMRTGQMRLRTARPGTSLVASAPGAASALSGSVTIPAITDTGAGTINPIFRISRAKATQTNTAVFQNESFVSAGLQTYKGALDMLVEFVHEGAATVEIRYQAAIASHIRALVDGQIVNPTPAATPSDGNFSYYTLTLPDTGRHLVSVETGANFRFLGANRAGAATVSKPYDPRGSRLIVIGDSYTGATGAVCRFEGYATEAGRLLGLRDVVSSGAGGTGYLHTNTDASFPFPKYRSRIASDIVPMLTGDDIILVTGGQNDLTEYASVGAEAALLFAALKTAAPEARIFSLLPFLTSGTPGNYAPMRDGIKAAAEAQGITVIADPVAESWITGNGNTGSPNGSGNADAYVDSDAAHPSQAGHLELLAVKVAAALRAAGV